jgi:hypothetical protein
MIQQFAWIGSLLATVGATLDALNLRASQYRFVLYLAANILSIAYIWTLHSQPLLWQFAVMLLASIIGVWRWWSRSRARRGASFIRLGGSVAPAEPLWSRMFRRKRLYGSGW